MATEQRTRACNSDDDVDEDNDFHLNPPPVKKKKVDWFWMTRTKNAALPVSSVVSPATPKQMVAARTKVLLAKSAAMRGQSKLNSFFK